MPIQYIDRVTILTANATTGEYDAVATTDLVSRIIHVGAAGASSASERAELLTARRLLWGPAYALPSERVAVLDQRTGRRYLSVPGTQAAYPLLGAIHHRSIDLVEAQA